MSQAAAAERFEHEAFMYAGEKEFLAGVLDFIREGVDQGEPTLIVLAADKIRLLQRKLGRRAAQVEFADMNDVGANPARIIPAWREFVDRHRDKGVRLRGIGEPIFPERSGDEMVECHRHEAMLNLAFDDGPPWRLLCPYDTTRLSPAVIEDARHTHPILSQVGGRLASPDYSDSDAALIHFATDLPEPEGAFEELAFNASSLAPLRRRVSLQAARAGLGPRQVSNLVMAVNEVATNSLSHGGGAGSLRIWRAGDEILCEINDQGLMLNPLADRRRPSAETEDARGLWLVNHLCDLVEFRSNASGTRVRLRMKRRPRGAN